MEKLGFREEASEPNEGYQSLEAHPEHICRGESDHRLSLGLLRFSHLLYRNVDLNKIHLCISYFVL